MMIRRVKTVEREVAPRRIVEEGVERGYGGGVEEVPGKGERRRGIVKGCVDCHREESCKKGGEGEYDEGERSKRKRVLAGVATKSEARKAYLRRKWGTRQRPGRNKKAGKVMRLNMPKVMREPRRAEDRSEDRCCRVFLASQLKGRPAPSCSF